jgi:P-type conjugative transfer protein TrbJ
MRIQRIITTIVVCGCLIAMPQIALAIFGVGDIAIVADPANIEQTTLAVKGIADTIEQQKQMIEDQIAMVTQGAKNLLATPLDMANQLKALTDQYNSAMATVKGVGYTLNGAKQQWDALYGAATGNQGLMQKASLVAQAIQAASSQANQMQAVYERLCQQATQMQTLLRASKAAPGSLAAQQVQSQITAIMSDQLNTLTQIELAAGKVQIMQAAEYARQDEQAAKNSQHWIQGYTDPANMPVGFGQGKGRTLD